MSGSLRPHAQSGRENPLSAVRRAAHPSRAPPGAQSKKPYPARVRLSRFHIHVPKHCLILENSPDRQNLSVACAGNNNSLRRIRRVYDLSIADIQSHMA